MENWIKYRPNGFFFEGGWVRNWFSNMIPCKILVEGYEFDSTEHYYQAMKAGNTLEFQLIRNASTPQESKKLAKNVLNPFQYLLADRQVDIIWDRNLSELDNEKITPIEKIKLVIMYMGLVKKFQLDDWKDRLLQTNDDMIIEWVNWNDTFWGVSIKDNKGHNFLGKLLMIIRKEIKS